LSWIILCVILFLAILLALCLELSAVVWTPREQQSTEDSDNHGKTH